jgi:hypothetical protein
LIEINGAIYPWHTLSRRTIWCWIDTVNFEVVILTLE